MPQGKIYYHRLPEFARKENKLDFLSNNSLSTVDWQRLVPNQKHTWRRTDTEDEFDSFLSIGSKEAKRLKVTKAESTFKLYCRGATTSRDGWAYAFAQSALREKIQRHIDNYNFERARLAGRNLGTVRLNQEINRDHAFIKWTDRLITALAKDERLSYQSKFIRHSMYRPFTRKHLYFDPLLTHRQYQQQIFFPGEQAEAENRAISLSAVGSIKPFHLLMTDAIPELHLTGDTQCFPFYTYDEDGSNRRENITDYALDQFRSHYDDPAISKRDIFYYVYGLLHHPGYRERYALDLKRNLPRIPFAPTRPSGDVGASHWGARMSESQFASTKSPPIAMGGRCRGGKIGGFWPFSQAGQQLADLHLNYESVERHKLDWQAERKPPSFRVEKMLPKGKVDSAEGSYKVYHTLKYNDTLTLHGIPERAFAYRLGNRSALDWIVDQYRVKTDKRSGITHDPNGYSDDPQYILKLIERVITVSLRTVDIVEQLAALPFRSESADN